MIVTDITPQKRKNRFNVFLDDQFWFGVSSNALIKGDLHKGKQVEPEALEGIIKEEITDRIKQRCIKKIARRPHSVAEIKKYCQRTLYKKLNDWLEKSFVKIDDHDQKEIIDTVVKKLNSLGLLSDKEFAQWWFKSRKRSKPRSSFMIKGELFQKGISKQIINELNITKQDDLEMAEALVEKKFGGLGADRDRVITYLQNKKFRWDIIETVLKSKKIS